MKTKKGEKVRYIFTARKNRPAVSDPTAITKSIETDTQSTSSTGRQIQPVLLEVPTPNTQGAHNTANSDSNANPVLLQRMLNLKISPDVAHELFESTPPEVLQLQLDCLDDRDPRNRAATFVKAVRQSWEGPPKYFERLEAIECAESSKRQQATQIERKSREEAIKQEETIVQEREAAGLDAMWKNWMPQLASGLKMRFSNDWAY